MRKSEFLIKYVLSYVLLLVLPMCILFFLLHAHSVQLVEKNFTSIQHGAVIQANNMLETEMNRVYEILSRTKLNMQFSIAKLDSANYEYISAVNLLKDFVVYSNVIQSVVIYNGEDRILLSEKGTFPAKYFGSEICQFDAYDSQTLKRRIQTMRANTVSIETVRLVGDSYQRCLVHWYPFADYSDQTGSMLMVFVGLDAIDDILGSMRGASDSTFAVLDGDQKVITAAGAQDIDMAALLARISLLDPSVQTVTLDGVQYFVDHSYGGKTGWIYLYAVPYREIASELTKLRSRYFTILATLMGVSSVLIYVFLRLNYTPLKRLQKNVKAFLDIDDNLNEIDTIQEAFVLLSDRIQWVNQRMQQMAPAMQCYAVKELLQGRMPAEPYAQALGIRPGKWLVALAYPAAPESAGAYLQEHAPLCMGKEACVCVSMPADRQCLLLLINYPDTQADIWRALQLLVSGYLGATGNRLNLFVGGDSVEVPAIPRALYDAEQTHALSALQPEREITVLAHTISSQERAETALEDIRSAAEIAFITRDVETLLNLAERLQLTDWMRTSVYSAQGFLHSMPRIAAKNIKDTPARRQLLQSISDAQQPFWQRQDAETFLTASAQILRAMARSITCAGRSEEAATFLSNVISLVDEKYLNAGFSLASVASELNVSPSWLSHFFKDNMHMTLIEYVNGKKMETAKEQIRSTDTSMAELAEKLGYQSVSSFIRSFKKEVRMTPGQYKAACRQRENDS